MENISGHRDGGGTTSCGNCHHRLDGCILVSKKKTLHRLYSYFKLYMHIITYKETLLQLCACHV